jgi:hypothetical protein
MVLERSSSDETISDRAKPSKGLKRQKTNQTEATRVSKKSKKTNESQPTSSSKASKKITREQDSDEENDILANVSSQSNAKKRRLYTGLDSDSDCLSSLSRENVHFEEDSQPIGENRASSDEQAIPPNARIFKFKVAEKSELTDEIENKKPRQEKRGIEQFLFQNDKFSYKTAPLVEKIKRNVNRSR